MNYVDTVCRFNDRESEQFVGWTLRDGFSDQAHPASPFVRFIETYFIGYERKAFHET